MGDDPRLAAPPGPSVERSDAGRPAAVDRPAAGVGTGRERPATIGAAGRWATARLDFAVGGGRTVLARQHVPYPVHVTRPFRLDAALPGLATLYLQSASGGLYRGDDVGLEVDVGAAAAVHLTTQAATVVHDGRRVGARQRTAIRVGEGGFAAFTPDPLVLFPGAWLESRTEITLDGGAAAIVAEGICRHDPAGGDAPFDRFEATTIVRDASGRVLVADRGGVDGADLTGAASPLGPWRAFGTCLVLVGRSSEVPGGGSSPTGAAFLSPMLAARLSPMLSAGLEAAASDRGCLAGASTLPNGAGLAVRLLAVEGGALARGLDAVFATAFAALLGVPPAPRRK